MGKYKDEGDLEITFFAKPEAAMALAQLLKRIDYASIKGFTVDENQLEWAKVGINDVQHGLAEAGISPR